MNAFKRRFGLRWRGNYPHINWRSIAEFAAYIAVILSVYAIAELITRIDAQGEQIRRHERRADKAERLLVACLNKQAIAVTEKEAIICETQKITIF